jgi:hypothetical protein
VSKRRSATRGQRSGRKISVELDDGGSFRVK